MGAFNNPVVLPYRPTFYESTLGPAALNFVANLAMAKLQHNWQMDIADRQIKAQAAQRQALKADKPTNTPKGTYSYFTGKDWRVANKPVSEQEKQAAIAKKEEDVAFKKGLMKGDFFQMTPAEYETLPPAMRAQQTFLYNGQPYVRGANMGNQTVAKIKGTTLLKWLNNEPLTDKQKKIVAATVNTPADRLDQTRGAVGARIDATMEAFKKHIGREPTQEEKVALIMKNPFLAMMSTMNNPEVPQALLDYYKKNFDVSPDKIRALNLTQEQIDKAMEELGY